MSVWAGIDGCRRGWVLALLVDGAAGTPPGLQEVTVQRSFAATMARARRAGCRMAGVDIPIGIPADGVRPAEGAARRLLGPRRSSVFPTPARAVLGATDYADALHRSRRVTGKGLSRQAWNLLPKIIEVDRWMAEGPSAAERWVHEIHPELAFARLAGAPLEEPKRSPDGQRRRRDLLAGVLDVDEAALDALIHLGRGSGAAADDVLDALAVACSARGAGGGPLTTLGDGRRDEHGLIVRISY
jgi:predicted RNase H-like nuclease